MTVERINAKELDYRQINQYLRELGSSFEESITVQIEGVCGERYLTAGFQRYPHKVYLEGTVGNDLAAFSDGVDLTVWGNCQDGVGNTMNAGRIVVHGSAGDVLGYSQRGGVTFVRGDVGYRAGVHLKGVVENWPTIVIGGSAGDFLGEYMAGGTIIVLGMENTDSPVGEGIASGMHGGEIFIRGQVKDFQVGKEVLIQEASEEEIARISPFLNEYTQLFQVSLEKLMAKSFLKLAPRGHRPYGKLYA